jgi:cytochrome c553
MQRLTLPLAMAIVALGAGCSSLDRSRNLANLDVSGQTLAQQVCSNCHGVDGNSVSPNFPNLAAQPKDYLIAELDEFRKHTRVDPAGFEYMWGLSHNLTDKQIGELADYFAAQTTPPCKACHGESGAGDSIFPRIAYQHADYIVKQLSVFKRTEQRPDAALMKVVAHTLTKEDMADVAQYLQGMTASGQAR